MKITLTLLLLFLSRDVLAYVAGSTLVPDGAIEVSLKTEFMRGLAGPENKPETAQSLVPNVNIVEVGAGYTLGSVGFLKDVKLKLSGSYFDSEAEVISGNSFYGTNHAGIIGVEVSGNFLHDSDRIFGIFIRSQHPVGMNVDKFVNPKVDRFGIGIQSASKFAESWGQETTLYFGSGASGSLTRQNPSFTAMIQAAWILSGSLFPHGAALKLGPFFDGDVGERNDPVYGTTGVRSFRLGFVGTATYSLSRTLALDVIYAQKITGAYFRATKDVIFNVRWII